MRPVTVHGRLGLGGIGLSAFVVLGISDAMLGVAWPSMRETFHRSLGSLGILLVAVAVGFVLTSVPTGRILARLGVGLALASAAGLAACAAATFSLAPLWWSIVAAAVLLGCAGGVVDGGINTVFAQAGRRRFLNLIHGIYGAGTVVGPLVVTAGLVAFATWRAGYAALTGLEILLALAWLRYRAESARGRSGRPSQAAAQPKPAGALSGPPTRPATEPAAGDAGPARSETRVAGIEPPSDRSPAPGAAPAVLTVLGLVAFFLCAGAEMTAGQWAASFLRGPVGLSAGVAGLVVSGFWASFAAVRLVLAIPQSPPSSFHVTLLGCLAALCGSVLLWWRPTPAVTVGSLALIGAGLAPVFPAMVSLTPVRLGDSRAQHVMGWQMAAAGMGGTGLSALVGVVLDRAGLGALGAVLVVLTIALCLANVLLELRASGGLPGPR